MRVELQSFNLMLFLSGVISNLKVEYQHELICAVKGSTVSIPCLFYNPRNRTVQRVLWGHVKSTGKKQVISFGTPGKAIRGFEYIGDKLHNCSLKIHQVGHNHAGKYMVMFNKASRLPVDVAPSLNVADLTISMTKSSRTEAIKEGDSVNLTCVNNCDDSKVSSTCTWFKNGESIFEGPFLYLRNISPAVSGNYACSLKTYPRTISRAVHIDVEYGPKNTSLIVRPPGAADAGSNVTLICSSNANPPVENYTWFKTGGEEILSVGHQLMFSPAGGGEYFCSATSKHGSQSSSTVVINTRNYHETFSRDTLVIATVGSFLIVITIILVIRICKKRMRPTNTDCDDDAQNTDYVNWLASETIQSQDGHLPESGTEEIYYTTIVFHNKRRANMEQQADFHHHEDVTYNSVGR